MNFPEGFVWGAATAAFQVEGAVNEGGRKISIWDHFTRWDSSRFFEGNNADTACDHYGRWEEDIGLMKEIGLAAYRFSVSWPRVVDPLTGTPNRCGLDFYERLVDGLLEAGIEPWLTLYHWDLPLDIHYRGGWINPETPVWFERYVKVVVDRLSDRVTHWITLNEPQCFIGFGLQTGIQAPFQQLPLPEILKAAHHALLAHGRAVGVLRSCAKRPAVIGWAPVGDVAIPATDSPADIEAARRSMFEMTNTSLFNNTWFADPVVKGEYPADGVAMFGGAMPDIEDSDMSLISQPIDFYGVNIYSGRTVNADADGCPVTVETDVGAPLTDLHWKITPSALYWGPRFLHERYGLPVFITENGMANCDWVHRDGRVPDPQRIDFTDRYLSETRRACADGVPVQGYFHWTLMDNFEWTYGYQVRLGLIHVDFETKKRTIKDSGHWYRKVIQTNGASLDRGKAG